MSQGRRNAIRFGENRLTFFGQTLPFPCHRSRYQWNIFCAETVNVKIPAINLAEQASLVCKLQSAKFSSTQASTRVARWYMQFYTKNCISMHFYIYLGRPWSEKFCYIIWPYIFVVIWYFWWYFGIFSPILEMLDQEKSGNPGEHKNSTLQIFSGESEWQQRSMLWSLFFSMLSIFCKQLWIAICSKYQLNM
jgi:hypothetical protein